MGARLLDHGSIAITGYTDRVSVAPGESVCVHASSVHREGAVRLVRLGHDGERFTTDAVTAFEPISLGHQSVRLGSHGIVDNVQLPAPPLAMGVWVWVTRFPEECKPVATLLACGGLTLELAASGRLTFQARQICVTGGLPLQLRRWYHLECGLDVRCQPFLRVAPQRAFFGERASEHTVVEEPVAWRACTGEMRLGCEFDGKLEAVSIRHGEGAGARDVLRLDFARGISTWQLHDDQGASIGRVVGLPTRGVRGRRWDGSQHEWRHAPDHYAAIHFHTDDQGDQQWPVAAHVRIPKELPAGVYAIELSAAGAVDHLPLIVRRVSGTPASLLVLLPSVSYLTYCFEHTPDELCAPLGATVKCRELSTEFARSNGYHSLYDTHLDGSPVLFASLHRPLLGFRPGHRVRFSNCEHQFSADLHLIGWLARQGFDVDVITDHDLDAEGARCLAPYMGVITGHHPEYVTRRMYVAIEAYLESGGNLAYLGGNGFRVTATLDPNDPATLEVLRSPPSRLEGEVGEEHYQLTGSPGGNWVACGRMEGALLGVSWACTGFEAGVPFRRTPASSDPRVSHLFDGIGEDQLIGDCGAILGAAASWEVDFANPLLGTPPHALVVATATMPRSYVTLPMPLITFLGSETEESRRRADMTYFEARGGGAVFSAASMGWVGALSACHDQNPVSRITANALHGFLRRRGTVQ